MLLKVKGAKLKYLLYMNNIKRSMIKLGLLEARNLSGVVARNLSGL